MRDMARLDWIAKLGFLARAVVYVMLGYIALSTRAKADEGQSAVFDALGAMPGGTLILVLTAIGLLAYGVFRLTTAFLDLDHKGDDAKGLAQRMGQFFSGGAHILLGYTAYQYVSQVKQPSKDSGASQEAAQTILDLPLGSALLALVGFYMLVTAGSQAWKAYKASFMNEIDPAAPAITCTLGRIGHAARAVVFAIVGWSMIQAALSGNEGEAKAIGGAIASLRDNDTLYILVAAGLLLFGLFTLILARYRIVPKVDIVAAAKRRVAPG